MNVLALDLGTHCGFALLVNGDLSSGVYEFEKTSHPGERFDAFRRWAKDMALGPMPMRGRKVDLIVYEKPLGRMAKSQAQVDLSIGFKTRLEELAWRYKIRLEPVHIATLKKATTGNGSASKEAMVAAINSFYGRSLTLKDNDEADALALLRYARRWEQLGNDSVFPQWKTEKGDPF